MDTFAAWLAPYLSNGSLLALPLVIIGGLITAFNPCCLPMYPAIFGFMGRSCCQVSEGENNVTPAPKVQTRIALIFVLGMATATALMGLLTAGLGWVFGRFDPLLQMTLALVPLAMGLHLLGLLPIKLPAWSIKNLPDFGTQRFKHSLTAFGAGLAFSLAIAPCATPILLGILTLVAMQGDMLWGTVLMFIYGLGTGIPLLFIGHGYERLQPYFAAPRHLQWLRTISGLLLMGVGGYMAWLV
jgi:cytochrome c-type biogenesis protein